MIGPSAERWDLACIAEYPNALAFAEMVRDPECREHVKHRQAAVEDSRLISFLPLSPGKFLGEKGVPRSRHTIPRTPSNMSAWPRSLAFLVIFLRGLRARGRRRGRPQRVSELWSAVGRTCRLIGAGGEDIAAAVEFGKRGAHNIRTARQVRREQAGARI